MSKDDGTHAESTAAACARSLADDAGLQISERLRARISVAPARGTCDAIALKQAHHDGEIHQRFAPVDALARRWYALMERERYEALGANQYAGVGQNLDGRWPFKGLDEMGGLPETEQVEGVIAGLCRSAFRLNSPDSQSAKAMTEDEACSEVFSDQRLARLAAALHDQAAFSALSCRLVSELSTRILGAGGFEAAVDAHADSAEDAPSDPDESDDDSVTELDDSAASDEPESDVEDALAEGQGDSEPADALPEQALDEAPIAGPDPTIVISGDTQPYRAYTTDFDEIDVASCWADGAQLVQWREELDQHIALHGRLVRRLAARLQRVLLARQKRHWQFDLEEGQLDSARLSRIISDPLMPLSFKAESDTAFRNTTITLLIDNSRSMLGRPIMIAAACADILARTLERCGVSVEILGFTTVHLHGGSSTERWEQHGKPDNPGRLNDLRHIVYKSADMPYRNARRNLGLMLDKDILKQNIDGEALMWAYQRLMKRPEERRILITISDGAPVDTSTLGANAGDFLARHLQQVIDDIEGAESIELMAIGIGHDVSRFYSQAVSVFDARQLGPVMLDKLERLFRQAA